MPRVDILGLERGEQQLHGSSIVGVGTCEADGHLQLLQHVESLLAGVVGGVVQEQNGVVAPVGILAVQLPDEVGEEDGHHLVVGVGLDDAQERRPCATDRSDHGDARRDSSVSERRKLRWLPVPPGVAGGVDPRLVDVDDAFALLEESQHDHCVLLLEHQAPFAVGLYRHEVHCLVLQRKFLHRRLHEGLR